MVYNTAGIIVPILVVYAHIKAIPIWIGTKFENPFKFTFLAFTLADTRFCNIRNNFEIL